MKSSLNDLFQPARLRFCLISQNIFEIIYHAKNSRNTYMYVYNLLANFKLQTFSDILAHAVLAGFVQINLSEIIITINITVCLPVPLCFCINMNCLNVFQFIYIIFLLPVAALSEWKIRFPILIDHNINMRKVYRFCPENKWNLIVFHIVYVCVKEREVPWAMNESAIPY